MKICISVVARHLACQTRYKLNSHEWYFLQEESFIFFLFICETLNKKKCFELFGKCIKNELPSHVYK